LTIILDSSANGVVLIMVWFC